MDCKLEIDCDLRAYMAGRVLTGLLTRTGPFAMTGGLGYYLQQGLSVDEAMIESVIGGRDE